MSKVEEILQLYLIRMIYSIEQMISPQSLD